MSTPNAPVVLITGALTGIGRATALAFAHDGARIAISGRRDEAGQQLLAELRALGVEAEYWRADVRHEDDVRNLVDKTVERFGRLDIAINNAGTEGKPGPVTETSPERYAAISIPTSSAPAQHEARVARDVGQQTRQHRQPVLCLGRIGTPGASVYVASKHAVEGLTKSAALEAIAFGVRVNAVAPGPVETEKFDRFTGGNAAAKAGFVASVPAQSHRNPRGNRTDHIVCRLRQGSV